MPTAPNVTIIPARVQTAENRDKYHQLRVAAYCRVSTEQEDRDTYNRVQQELARRSSKRKISDKTTTEQGKYSSKYALTELLICGQCGTPYRRTTWAAKGKKQIVWRCISRLEHGKQGFRRFAGAFWRQLRPI